MFALKTVGPARRMAWIGLALALAAVSVVLCAPVASDAQTKCGLEFYYYSDPDLTNLVGMRGYWPTSCGCGSYGWGVTTGYREIDNSFC